ncbi:hypothetical protein CYMTET_14917 [Cymbomonas tetramitiformis]|uniref:Methyltransferase type 11 domain-containing protein n=1 Tax=Cymbomonas tetramitiformis TaxID=36881 RepID=A0AAE0L9J4_9CHLO|nr:hypothetical protein CYMTET_14917 [Cymbomonas tetramitiformis]
MGDVLEHIPDLYTALTEAARVLKPGGSLVMSTMNRSPQTFCLQGLFQKFLPGYPTAGPSSLDDWRMYVTPEEISKGLQSASMELMESDISLLWPSIDFRKLISNEDPSFIGTFWALRAPFGVGSRLLARFGPYLAWARKSLEVSGEEEVTHWFPAGVQHEDGSVSMPTDEEIEAYSVEYDGT